MSGSSAYVIAGAGLAGAKAAETLREEGFDGPVVLIGDEAERPYERPPLSKDYLLGKAERETIYVHPASWYADNGVELRLGVPVTGIDRAAHEVALADGTRIGYARLLLATGSSPRRLPVPGADADGVLYLRRVGDSDQIKATFQAASRIAVIGAGWIGLEAPPRPARRASRSPCWRRPSCRCCGCSAPRSPGSSPACTASTASTCGSACR